MSTLLLLVSGLNPLTEKEKKLFFLVATLCCIKYSPVPLLPLGLGVLGGLGGLGELGVGGIGAMASCMQHEVTILSYTNCILGSAKMFYIRDSTVYASMATDELSNLSFIAVQGISPIPILQRDQV